MIADSFSWHLPIGKDNLDNYCQVCTVNEVKETFSWSIKSEQKLGSLFSINFTQIYQTLKVRYHMMLEKNQEFSHKRIFFMAK